MESGGWIGVDLDGTLAEYNGWKGASHIGEPIPEMLDRVKRWIADGVDVRIFTARIWFDSIGTERHSAAQQAHSVILGWCKRHIGRTLPITCMKDYGMIELWDDRAVQVIPNTGRRADGLA